MAYLSKERLSPAGMGLEELDREPVPEWMAESTEVVMGAGGGSSHSSVMTP